MEETIYRIVRQYNKNPVPRQDMEKLREIASDYAKVKNYVYERYGGIGGLSKLYPGYTIQNEMTKSGLRTALGLPSVYFYLAVFEALADIKGRWTAAKSKIYERVHKNENLTAEEKHYIRFLLKTGRAFEQILNQKPVELPKEIQKRYEELAKNLDEEKLKRYLRRQVRKSHTKPHTDAADQFTIAERAYRYADHGIYITTKENRKRIFIRLTDHNQYKSQLSIKLLPAENDIEIKAAIRVAIHSRAEYTNQVGVAFGMYTMFTTHEGHCYGEDFGRYQMEYAEWVRRQAKIYSQNRQNNPGRKKYFAKKRKYEEHLHSYINHELNRFFEIEKPETVYIVKMPRPHVSSKAIEKNSGFAAGTEINKKINHSVTMWQRGFIKNRLTCKCAQRSVKLAEVLGKNISNECCRCGAIGTKKEHIFYCESCGYKEEEKINTANNVLNRGINGKILC